MRAYVAAVFGWDDLDQRRRFDALFDPQGLRVIQADGRDAGLLAVEERADHLFLARIEIVPEWQNRGIGSTVIRSVLADARRRQKNVVLRVLRPNPARALYERLGFRLSGETATHFQMRYEPESSFSALPDPA